MEKKKDNKRIPINQLAIDGLLTAMLVITGMIKLPSVIPGTEFQISAPFAICIVSLVGFKRYLCIGVISSVIQLLLGTHTIINVCVAMVFRIVAGLIVEKCKKKPVVIAAGPIGTAAARVVLSFILNVPAWTLIAASIPGMVFTAVCVAIVLPILKRVLKNKKI